MIVNKKFILKGRVQGVGFRFFTKKNANELSIKGTVKNLTNGDVEVFAKGEDYKIDKFKAKLIKGNSFSRVENIEEYELDDEINSTDFHVEY